MKAEGHSPTFSLAKKRLKMRLYQLFPNLSACFSKSLTHRDQTAKAATFSNKVLRNLGILPFFIRNY